MLTAFWITDTCGQNVGGKTRQFETLEAVIVYATKAKLAEQDDFFTVHNLAEDNLSVPLHEVQAVFTTGQNPVTLANVRNAASQNQPGT